LRLDKTARPPASLQPAGIVFSDALGCLDLVNLLPSEITYRCEYAGGLDDGIEIDAPDRDRA
jgi:hypothetical protein